MLTTIMLGRVWDYDRTIGRLSPGGGMGFHWPLSMALGRDEMIYVLSRSNETFSTPRVTMTNLDEDFIGEFGERGDGDGQFLWPVSVACDSDGNVYVSDEWLNRISVFDKNGKFLSKWGGQGTGEGEFEGPSGIIFDEDDNLYVVDSRNHRIQQYSKDGKFLSAFGKQGSGDGEFDSPWGIRLDHEGNIYVADWKNHRVQKFQKDGSFVAKWGGSSGSGVGELNHPTDMAVDKDGDVYVADWGNNRVQIYEPDGHFITSLIGDSTQPSKWAQMSIDANPDVAKGRRRVRSLEPEYRFFMPTGVLFDYASNRLFVVDTQRCRLQIYKKLYGYTAPQYNF